MDDKVQNRVVKTGFLIYTLLSTAECLTHCEIGNSIKIGTQIRIPFNNDLDIQHSLLSGGLMNTATKSGDTFGLENTITLSGNMIDYSCDGDI
ncbi:MAG: hypothetical protein HOI47_14800 [Candidatus Scalindua sp.]|jgi:hypothetical protein|nr:hypothetical protein [Candidatus Scalindua sp.]MBT6227912.1 hypothetical protein [Candidatus Scalindua sp.]